MLKKINFIIIRNLLDWNAKYAFSSPLIVGNPYLPKNPDWIVPPLPGAESEAKEVAKLTNDTPLIGKEATKDLVGSKAPNSSLLYFVTHCIGSTNNPLTNGFLIGTPR
ncbi:MAG: CHAT domain-containing protein [Phormidium sp.]